MATPEKEHADELMTAYLDAEIGAEEENELKELLAKYPERDERPAKSPGGG